MLHSFKPASRIAIGSLVAAALVFVAMPRATQARDHPVLLNVPETRYLKCLILRKL